MFKLWHIVELKYKDKFTEYFSKSSVNLNQILAYISKNILPMDIKIKLDEKNQKPNSDKQTKNRGSTSNYYKNILYRDHLFGKIEENNNMSYYFNKKI